VPAAAAAPAKAKKRARPRTGWYWVCASPVGCWNEDGDDEEFAVCVFMVPQDGGSPPVQCGHRLKIKGGHDGMRGHAEAVHGLMEAQANNAAATKRAHVTITDFFPTAPVVNAKQKAFLNTRLVIALSNDGRPYSLFEKHAGLEDSDRAAHDDKRDTRYGLGEWLALLHPGYSVPARSTLRGIAVDDLVPQIKVDITKILAHCDYVAFTSDGWKNTSQNVSYRDLSCHGIVRIGTRYRLVSFLLGMKPLVPKDANSVGRWIRDLIEEYSIPQAKCGVLTADGAEEASAREAGLEYWWCCAHWINLAIHDAIKSSDFIASEIETAKALVTSVRTSGAYQAILNAAAGHRVYLKQDVETRWSSEWLMIDSILKPEHLRAVRVLFERHPDLRISESGLDLLRDIHLVLDVPYALTKNFESQTKVMCLFLCVCFR
jgi:hypothetical protein